MVKCKNCKTCKEKRYALIDKYMNSLSEEEKLDWEIVNQKIGKYVYKHDWLKWKERYEKM